ncbi:MAG: adenosylcobalamin-dependent ribonucleoside-diphosphate reductase [Nanobdellota archaeon]
MSKKGLEGKVKYTNKEAIAASHNYFNGDEMAAKNFVNKYALKDSDGNVYELSPSDMHHRLAKEFARIENKYAERNPNANPVSEEKFYDLMDNFKYIIPQGGSMSGVGNNYQIVSLSNCFVIGNGADSYGGIMTTDHEQVQLMKRRGGVGHDLSHIRPKGSPVLNSALTSTGVVPFMERYSNSTREVAQDGRRGALMLSLSIRHPDAQKFIDAKLEQGKVTGANVSVKLTDDFMRAVENNEKYIQQYPVDSDKPKFTNEIDAIPLWNKIIHNAWKSAEPGVLFWDTIRRESIPDCYADLGYETVSTNPCGEIPLCPYDSCRLLAVNLYSYVKNPFTKNAEFDWNLYKEHIPYAQRMSDDIIDLEIEKIDGILAKIENDPEPEELKAVEKRMWKKIRRKAEEGRRHGLGITAEGDMLAGMGLTYGSEEAIKFSTEVHKTFAVESYRGSVDLAKERGAFEIYDPKREENNPFIQRLREADPALYEEMVKHGRRNIALLTIAPTGTTSIMTQTTSGIEPVFAPVYKRRRKVNPNDKDVKVVFKDETGDSWEEYNVFHHKFKDWLLTNGYSPENIEKYSDQELEGIIKESPYYKATANDVDWVQKVKMQGEIQKWVDHSISVTVNLPNDVSEELVSEVYLTAWKEGCKGVTVYRDGSRAGVLITNKEKNLEGKVFPKERPEEVEAKISRFKDENGKNGEKRVEDWIAFTGVIGGKPYETFTGKDDADDFHVPSYVKEGAIIKTQDKDGKTRYDFKFVNKYGDEVILPGISHAFNPEFHNYAILFSRILQGEMPINEILKTASKMKSENEGINSWIRGFSRSLKPFAEGQTALGESCEECKQDGTMIYQEGCLICNSCGSSKCG